MKDYLLALDLGTSSIGYVAFGINAKNEPESIKDLGVRIFSDGRDPETKEPLAVARRVARGIRRNRDRGQNRVRRLVSELIEFNLLPTDEDKRSLVFRNLDPYECRSKCVEGAVMPEELGRALFHLGRRRGFKSNRLSGESEETEFKEKITNLRTLIGEETLGQYLFTKVKENHVVRRKNRAEHVRSKEKNQRPKLVSQKPVRFRAGETEFYADREMYEKEFSVIKETQGDTYLTEEQWLALRETIFWQYPLKPAQKGKCRFFIDQPRAHISLPISHEFRILQEVNNLKYESGGLEFELDARQKKFMYNLLATVKSISFKSLAKKKDQNKSPYFPSDAVFNLDTGTRNGKLLGNEVLVDLRKPENLGPYVDSLDSKELNDIVDFLIEPSMTDENGSRILDETEILDWLEVRLAELQDFQVKNLCAMKFKRGTTSVSRKFLQKINPIMLDSGEQYWTAVQQIEDEAGLNLHHSNFETGEVLKKLPYYGEVMPESVWGIRPESDKDKMPSERDDDAYNFGKIANPTVHVALNQLRRVVNGVIDRLGKAPAKIHVELSRDLKNSKEARQKWDKEATANKKTNDRIRNALKTEFKIDHPSRGDLQKFKLWEELGAQGARQSVFSGKTISASQLFSGVVEIEHIVPFSDCRDDGMNNKTLAFIDENRDKGDRTPHAAFGNSKNYDEIMRRALSCFGQTSKYERFKEGAFEKFYGGERGDMIARQLNDTKYLSRKAAQYLSCLCTSNNVVSVNGQMTALMRDVWQLNQYKDRSTGHYRDDHRHHIVDAFVVGLTSKSLIRHLNTETGKSRFNPKGLYPFLKSRAPEIPELKRELFHRLESVVASHKPDRSMSGSMYFGTAYGIEDEAGVQWVVTRKEVYDLSYLEVLQIKSEKQRADLIKFLTNKNSVETKNELQDTLSSNDVFLLGQKEYSQLTEKNKLKLRDEYFLKKKKEYSQLTGIKKLRVRTKNDSVSPVESAPFKGYAINSYAYCDVWKIPIKRDASSEEWKYEYKGTFVTSAEVNRFDKNPKRPLGRNGKQYGAAKRIMRLFKNDSIRVTSFGTNDTTFLRVAGYSAGLNQLNLTQNLDALNKRRWFSINKLFKNNKIHKLRA